METLVLQFCVKKVLTPDASIMWNSIRSLVKCWGAWCEPYLEKYFWRDKDLAESGSFCVSMSHIQCFYIFLLFCCFFFKAPIHIQRYFLASIFVFSSQPRTKSARNTSKGCLHSQLSNFTAFNGFEWNSHIPLCLPAPTQTQLMTVTESQAKWPKQTLWYTGGRKGSFFTI